MKNRRGSGRAQFVSFIFPNTLIWAIESTARDGRQSQPARAAIRSPGDRSIRHLVEGRRRWRKNERKSARRVVAHRAVELLARQQRARSMSEGADVVVDAYPRDRFVQIDLCAPRISGRKGRHRGHHRRRR
jgi:hypothetical protein